MTSDFNPCSTNVLGRACEVAAHNAESGASLIAHYPLICLEVLKENKSWEQLEDEALNRFLRSLSPRRLNHFHEQLTAAREEDEIFALQRRVYNHYSMMLFYKLTRKNPKTYVMNEAEIA